MFLKYTLSCLICLAGNLYGADPSYGMYFSGDCEFSISLGVVKLGRNHIPISLAHRVELGIDGSPRSTWSIPSLFPAIVSDDNGDVTWSKEIGNTYPAKNDPRPASGSSFVSIAPGCYRVTLDSGLVYTYQKWKLCSITDSLGKDITVESDGARIVSLRTIVNDYYLEILKTGVDSDGRLVSISFPNQEGISISYNENGQVSQLNNKSNSLLIRFQYSLSMISLIDNNGYQNKFEWSYIDELTRRRLRLSVPVYLASDRNYRYVRALGRGGPIIYAYKGRRLVAKKQLLIAEKSIVDLK